MGKGETPLSLGFRNPLTRSGENVVSDGPSVLSNAIVVPSHSFEKREERHLPSLSFVD